MRHTPEPWSCTPRGEVLDVHGRVIALVGRVGHPTESVSNGFLIEAAPALLKRLRALVAAEDQFTGDTDVKLQDGVSDEVEAARELLTSLQYL